MSLKSIAKYSTSYNTICTDRYKQHLLEHKNDIYPESVARRIYEQLIAVPRVRRHTISASSADICTRLQLLKFYEEPVAYVKQFTANNMNIFDNGTWTHLRIQARMLWAGILDDIEVATSIPDKRSYGTIDGVGTVPHDHKHKEWRGKEFIAELKSINSYGYSRCVRENSPKSEHIDQVQRYMLHTGIKLASIFYENKDTNDIHEWVVEADDNVLDEHRLMLDEINECIEEQKIPDMMPSCSKKVGSRWKYCQYSGDDGACMALDGWPEGWSSDV